MNREGQSPLSESFVWPLAHFDFILFGWTAMAPAIAATLSHIIHSAETIQTQNATETKTGKVYTMASRIEMDQRIFRVSTTNGETIFSILPVRFRSEESDRARMSLTLVMRGDKNTLRCLLASPQHFPARVISRSGSKVWFSKSSLYVSLMLGSRG
jgi:hypothetical protein